ncbi:MAG TPA: hypothetical protein PLD23_05415 [Armatimonadota bacterium]|nr:hypothetical protein [Armatimonadota bacterium]
MAEDEHDLRRIYCPSLGMMVEFAYCRAAGRQLETGTSGSRRLPCQRLLGCWSARLDVGAFLARTYSPEELAEFASPTTTRLERLYAAASRASEGGETG